LVGESVIVEDKSASSVRVISRSRQSRAAPWFYTQLSGDDHCWQHRTSHYLELLRVSITLCCRSLL